MNEIIKVSARAIGQQTVATVDARELWGFLGVKKDFTNWIKAQVQRARLVEGRDFVVFAQKGENSIGGRPQAEYALTIDAGKHIAMMAGTDKGFEVRDYFIECERRALSQPAQAPVPDLSSPDALRGLLLTYTERVIAAEAVIAEQAPKVDALHRIAEADGSLCLTDAAKVLQVRPRLFMQWLHAHRWIYRRAGAGHWCAHQERIQQGLVEQKLTTYTRGDGSEMVTEQVRVTPKGITKLAESIDGARAS